MRWDCCAERRMVLSAVKRVTNGAVSSKGMTSTLGVTGFSANISFYRALRGGIKGLGTRCEVPLDGLQRYGDYNKLSRWTRRSWESEEQSIIAHNHRSSYALGCWLYLITPTHDGNGYFCWNTQRQEFMHFKF
ncbi:hypothetical protein TNIN_217331 [Trichonephila inaurata madagascariensis]|uniref:Uncharacterized protein n=1 Tax=Trichonephila inaurata madagascariensis TaxID=2747483 RepID=A0A8X6XW83_9ARAC|nr:hypothetical protein TNIN_217331 [Trichonephila inaurata madagascariensis]